MLKIEGLTKRYGSVAAVDGLDLEILEGEFFTLLGPSGCGKTTTLRCLGGLEKADGGEIFLRDRCLVSVPQHRFVPPERREMGMVFQSYALWPHMSVFENVAYPLKLRHASRDEIRRRVADALRLVGLEAYSERQAPLLSGGQQQRVALARALVFSPQVLLLDEPLSNLDALLRDEMRHELKELRDRVNVTMIYVTHDQVEALSLSSRIAIMNQGKLDQVGTPQEVYSHPATPFAQTFLGKTLSVPGRVASSGSGSTKIIIEGADDFPLHVSSSAERLRTTTTFAVGDAVDVAIRPEQIRVWPERPDGQPNIVATRVRSALFVGDRYEYVIELGHSTPVLPLPSNQVYQADEYLYLEFPEAAVTIWPK
ncbi:MAG: transporter protein [Chloroflexi bacterium]|nr:transporter protein [Chloroflexota bacterium]